MSDEEIEYVEESGPGITELPELPAGPPQEQLPGGGTQEYPGWQQETIEQFLLGTGEGVHFLIGQGERDWQLSKKDLERIAPPLTRICNRWEPALRVSPAADPLLVAHGLALYAWRSVLEAQRAKRDREPEPELAGARYETGPEEAPAGETAGAPGAGEFEAMELEVAEPYFPESPRARRSS